MNTDIAYLLLLLSVSRINRRALRLLYVSLESWERIFNARDSVLRSAGIDEKIILEIRKLRTKSFSTDAILEPYYSQGIAIISYNHKYYPPLLKEADDAPIVLFVRGQSKSLINTPCVTIVGSRNHTQYGKHAATQLSSDLARAGVTVVSGLARGIDGIAHHGALDAGGVTIGVLGSSVEDCFISPVSNQKLAKAMMEDGAIISEYPLGIRGANYTFPARNRIMAAMAHITLVIEAADRSGTLITARNALEYNRDVCAVPGDIFSEVSVGTNTLIKNGAKIVRNVTDILDELPQNSSIKQTSLLDNVPSSELPDNLTDDEKKILRAIDTETLHVDKIIATTTLETTTILSTLAMLEIKGVITDIGSHNYRKK